MTPTQILCCSLWFFNRISAIAPPKKRTKNDVFGSANVENTHEVGPEFELAASHWRTPEHGGYYPNSNLRRIISDLSLFRCVMRLLADASASRTNAVKETFEMWAVIFLKNEKTPDNQTFLTQCVRYHSPGIKRFHQERSPRSKETSHVLFAEFSIFADMTIIWPRTLSFWPSQSSINLPNSKAVFVFDHLAGGRDNYKKKYSWISHQLQVGAFLGRRHDLLQFQIWDQFWIPEPKLHGAMYLIFCKT